MGNRDYGSRVYRASTRLLVMGAVAVMLLEVGSYQGSERDLIVLIYYEGVERGIGFNQERPPCYVDFAYLAFTIGMTFQDERAEDPPSRQGLISSSHVVHLIPMVT